MMVICIDASIGKRYGHSPSFSEGNILEVLPGNDGYYLVIDHEYCAGCCNKRVEWNESRFLPLSNIDEAEMISRRTSFEVCDASKA